MVYWVYENHPTNKARVHKAVCVYCNDGAGLRRESRAPTGQWHGPYQDVIESRTIASNTGRTDVRDCKVCAP